MKGVAVARKLNVAQTVLAVFAHCAHEARVSSWPCPSYEDRQQRPDLAALFCGSQNEPNIGRVKCWVAPPKQNILQMHQVDVALTCVARAPGENYGAAAAIVQNSGSFRQGGGLKYETEIRSKTSAAQVGLHSCWGLSHSTTWELKKTCEIVNAA